MNLLITGAWHQANTYLKEIKSKHDAVFLQYEKDELPCDPEWVEGIIGNGIFLSHPIQEFKHLKYIQLTSSGYDRVPIEYVRENNIKINNARDVYSIPMAEHAVSGVLSIYRQTSFFLSNQEKGKWEKKSCLRELQGKKVLILGCGSVGSECAKRFEAMGCTVFGIATEDRKQNYFIRVYRAENIKGILPKADIVIITLPLTRRTRYLFNEEMLGMMKDDAVLVNIARGAIVDTEALIKALKKGKISAVLDVFEDEPIPVDSEIWKAGNVLITPHISYVGEESDNRLSDVIMKNLEEYTVQDLTKSKG